MGTLLALNTEAAINASDIVVGNPLEWLAFLVESEKRICSSFDECLFIRIGLRSPFSNFELVALKHLKATPSQLLLGSWMYIRVFQLCVEHKSWKLSLSFFSYLFYLRRTSHDNFYNPRLIYFHLVNS